MAPWTIRNLAKFEQPKIPIHIVYPTSRLLSAKVRAFIDQMGGAPLALPQGFAPADVRKIVRLIKISEYKRRQAPIGVRITPRGFGKDWRYPITSKFRAWYSRSVLKPSSRRA